MTENTEFNVLLIGTYENGTSLAMAVISANSRTNSISLYLIDDSMPVENGGKLVKLVNQMVETQSYDELMSLFGSVCGISVARYVIFNVEKALQIIGDISVELSEKEVTLVGNSTEVKYNGKKILLSPQTAMDLMSADSGMEKYLRILKIARAAMRNIRKFSVKDLRKVCSHIMFGSKNNLSLIDLFPLLIKFRSIKNAQITKLLVKAKNSREIMNF